MALGKIESLKQFHDILRHHQVENTRKLCIFHHSNLRSVAGRSSHWFFSAPNSVLVVPWQARAQFATSDPRHRSPEYPKDIDFGPMVMSTETAKGTLPELSAKGRPPVTQPVNINTPFLMVRECSRYFCTKHWIYIYILDLFWYQELRTFPTMGHPLLAARPCWPWPRYGQKSNM